MRLLAALILTPITLGVLAQLPDGQNLDAEMVAYSDQGRQELEQLWAGTSKPVGRTVSILDKTSPPTTTPPTTTTSTTTSTTTTAVPYVVLNVRCQEWWTTAVEAGWSNDRIPVLLDRIVWAESRCLPDVDNGNDFGLTQVHWPVWGDMVHAMSYTQQGLYDPVINLRVALKISQEAENIGWRWCQPWDSSGSHC